MCVCTYVCVCACVIVRMCVIIYIHSACIDINYSDMDVIVHTLLVRGLRILYLLSILFFERAENCSS